MIRRSAWPIRLALLVALAAAAHPVRAAAGFSSATLDNGASVGFALLRSGPADPSGAIGDAALARSNGVSRVLWDRETGAYFGYRLEIKRQRSARPFRVTVKPLDPEAEGPLRQRVACASCPPPTPLAAPPLRYPAPQQLAEGDSLTLELLANPTTGEKILDVVKVSATPVSAATMKTAALRALESWEAVQRANGHMAQGGYRSALGEYLHALPAQRNDPVIHNKLGICYQNLKDAAGARAAYLRALELDPRYAEAWNNLATLEQSARRFPQAVEAYKKAISVKPGVANFWKNLASAHLSMGREAAAYQAYREAYRLDPTILERQPRAVDAAGVDAAAQAYYLAKILAADGQTDAALAHLRRARDAGFRDFARVEADPDFRAVVADPRFDSLRVR
jgi:tetratricopeptide (TPR) repeat protein